MANETRRLHIPRPRTLIAEIEAEAELTASHTARDRFAPAVMDAA
jgi:hypothetical protein